MTLRMQVGPPPDQIEALRRGWHPVALSTEVGDDPVQVWLLGEPWALWRVDGRVVAHVDRCPHRLVPISAGRRCDDGTVQCGYHGWRFDAAGGLCTLIPALGPSATIPPRARLTPAATVDERAGLVWIAPDSPLTPLIEVDPPEGATVGMLVPALAEVDAGELIDNFLDVAHFPFVHAGTFGSDQSDVVDDYDLQVDDHGFTAVTEHEFANHEDPAVAAGTRPLVQRRRLTYRYLPPFTATLRIDYLDAEGSNLIVFAVQPERAGWARVFTTLLRNDLPPAAMGHALEFEQRVLDEDLVVQRRMQISLPLDLTTEVHTKADRLTIELRRCLARFLGSGR
jgi:vanillate O-demethylase monooxygenase subunit